MRRSLDHSTIIYESPDLTPLLRLSWNKQDHNYIATFMMDQNKVVIMDIRYAPPSSRTELDRAFLVFMSLMHSSARHSLCAIHLALSSVAQSAFDSGRRNDRARGVRQWHRVGTALVVPHLHGGRRPAGADLGLVVDAKTNRGCVTARQREKQNFQFV